MPELPEVETIRRTLAPRLIGRVVGRVAVRRRDVVMGARGAAGLLRGCEIVALERHGKQLAIVGRRGGEEVEGAALAGRPPVAHGASAAHGSAVARVTPASERVLVIRLGMTGQLLFVPAGEHPKGRSHVHVVWTIVENRRPRLRAGIRENDADVIGRLVFRDPRRFGRVIALPSRRALAEYWSRLGPDALTIEAHDHPRLARLWRSRSPVKAALMNQSLLAGVGNIYADEALFESGIHPARRACSIMPAEQARLVGALRLVLRRAIAGGGSTIRDYVDGNGSAGAFTARHRVYGRAGLPCVHCATTLRSEILAQRTTVWCTRCQSPCAVRATGSRLQWLSR